MSSNEIEKLSMEISIWSAISLSVISATLGSGALWFTWFRYNSLLNRPEIEWYGRIQPIFFALMGILCLWAAILFVLRKPSGWPVFKTGLSMVPLLLFTNLLILLFRVIQNIFQGNVNFFFERVFAQPYKVILILAVVIALVLLGSLNEKREQ
jgi:hypothetical protein